MFLDQSGWRGYVNGQYFQFDEIPMIDFYKGENQPKLSLVDQLTLKRTPFELETRKIPGVRYFSSTEIAAFEIKLKDGLFYWSDGSLVHAINYKSLTRPQPIFVALKVANEIKMYLFTDPEKGKYHHSSLTGGKSVLMAGAMNLIAGRLTFISNKSGHYIPEPDILYLFVLWLKANGVNTDQVDISIFTRKQQEPKFPF